MAVAFGIRRAATAEIEQAFDWYESQRLGLGLEYLTAIEATLARIRREPLVFPVAASFLNCGVNVRRIRLGFLAM